MSWRRGYNRSTFVGPKPFSFKVPDQPEDEGEYIVSVDDEGNVTFVEANNLELGETADTAYYGDKGKIAYDHSQEVGTNPHEVTKDDIGLSEVTNDKQIPYSEKGEPNGVATLDDEGVVPDEQIDDIDGGTF